MWDIISSPTANAIFSGVVEILFRMYDDVNFQWYSGLIQGIFVGTCTFVGGITYGQVGIIIGKYLNI
jgi:hypothetical protein